MNDRIEKIKTRLSGIEDKKTRNDYFTRMLVGALHEATLDTNHLFNKEILKSLGEIAPVDMTDPKWSEKLHEIVFDMLEYEYWGGDRPDAPWLAIHWCHMHGLPFPDWLVRVLTGFSREVLDTIKTNHDKEVPESTRIGRILGFGGTGKGSTSAGAKAFRATRDQLMAIAVVIAKWKSELSLEAIYPIVGEQFHQSAKTVERAFHKIRKAGRKAWKAKPE